MGSSKFDHIKVDIPKEGKDETRNIPDPDNYSLDQQEIIRFGQDTQHRRMLIIWMMIVVSSWLLFVLFLTIFNKILCINTSDNVLIALLATTTINVLGLSKIILTGLFGNNRRRRYINGQTQKYT